MNEKMCLDLLASVTALIQKRNTTMKESIILYEQLNYAEIPGN